MDKIGKRYLSWLAHKQTCEHCSHYVTVEGDGLRTEAPCVIGKILILDLFTALDAKDWEG